MKIPETSLKDLQSFKLLCQYKKGSLKKNEVVRDLDAIYSKLYTEINYLINNDIQKTDEIERLKDKLAESDSIEKTIRNAIRDHVHITSYCDYDTNKLFTEVLWDQTKILDSCTEISLSGYCRTPNPYEE